MDTNTLPLAIARAMVEAPSVCSVSTRALLLLPPDLLSAQLLAVYGARGTVY